MLKGSSPVMTLRYELTEPLDDFVDQKFLLSAVGEG